MSFGQRKLLTGLLCWCSYGSCTAVVLADTTDFRAVLELAEIDPAQLSEPVVRGRPEATWQKKDWQIISQILYRLQQYSDAQLAAWTCPQQQEPTATNREDNSRPVQRGSMALVNCGPGALVQLAGVVQGWEKIDGPGSPSNLASLPVLYRCQFRNELLGVQGTILTRQIPRPWRTQPPRTQPPQAEPPQAEPPQAEPPQAEPPQAEPPQAEPVQLRAVILRVAREAGELSVLCVADRLAWYPQQGVPPGHLLLARYGMDIALWDEVIQRQPLVRPDISREGEAFYGCLAVLGRIPPQQLREACRQSVHRTAHTWEAQQAELRVQKTTLQTQVAHTSAENERLELTEQVAAVQQRLNVAAAVARQAEQGQSSVGPFFLDPAAEVGHLVRLVGTARRAVRIVVPERPEVDAYFELEVFVPESKYLDNRPVVCCVNQLPAGFPQGDLLRETVEISGVFFKSWRYRTRQAVAAAGPTNQARQLYTPLVLADSPRWIPPSALYPRPWSQTSWGLWAGAAFLVGLAALWLHLARATRRGGPTR